MFENKIQSSGFEVTPLCSWAFVGRCIQKGVPKTFLFVHYPMFSVKHFGDFLRKMCFKFDKIAFKKITQNTTPCGLFQTRVIRKINIIIYAGADVPSDVFGQRIPIDQKSFARTAKPNTKKLISIPSRDGRISYQRRERLKRLVVTRSRETRYANRRDTKSNIKCIRKRLLNINSF